VTFILKNKILQHAKKYEIVQLLKILSNKRKKIVPRLLECEKVIFYIYKDLGYFGIECLYILLHSQDWQFNMQMRYKLPLNV